jgi:hypothetical protein
MECAEKHQNTVIATNTRAITAISSRERMANEGAYIPMLSPPFAIVTSAIAIRRYAPASTSEEYLSGMLGHKPRPYADYHQTPMRLLSRTLEKGFVVGVASCGVLNRGALLATG